MVSNILYFHHLGRWCQLTNIFQWGWNQLEMTARAHIFVQSLPVVFFLIWIFVFHVLTNKNWEDKLGLFRHPGCSLRCVAISIFPTRSWMIEVLFELFFTWPALAWLKIWTFPTTRTPQLCCFLVLGGKSQPVYLDLYIQDVLIAWLHLASFCPMRSIIYLQDCQQHHPWY